MNYMKKAVFIDRDGVINYALENYVYQIEDFKINPGVGEALKIFSDKGYLLIVITNQGGIAKGVYNEGHVERLHDYMAEELRKSGVSIQAIYYCPHHPSVGNCLCRKPYSLMLEKAMARYGIDPGLSYFIGDADRDEQAAKTAGVTPLRIKPNTSLLDVVSLVR